MEKGEAGLNGYLKKPHKAFSSTHVITLTVCAEVKVTIGRDQLTITVKTGGFHKLIETHLNVRTAPHNDTFEITVPFKVGRAKRGAVILKPEGQDIFDIPSAKLKKIVQGYIWRDEHFAGMALKDIARREKYSEGYVGTAIFESFEFGKAA